MPITYPLSLPSSPAPRLVEWDPLSVAGVNSSPYSLVAEKFRHAGRRLDVAVTYPVMTRAQGDAFAAVLAALDGSYGTVLFGPQGPGATPKGVATGSPIVNPFNSGLSGNYLDTIGWTASITDILKAGDWLQLGRNYLRFPKDASNAAWGKVTCTVAPDTQVGITGDSTADRVTPAVGATAAQLFQTVILPSGIIVAARAFKFGIRLRAAGGTPSIGIYLVNQAGTIRAETVCAITTSWQAFEVSATMNAADTGVQAYFGGGDNPWTEAKGAIDVDCPYLDATEQSQRLLMNLQDTNSDGQTSAKFDVFPHMRSANEDFAPIVVASPKGVFRLKQRIQWALGSAYLYQPLSFELEEDF